jgi:predicted esterase
MRSPADRRIAEHHLQVARTARYFTLGDAAEPEELWIVCHGYAQLARYFLRAFAPIADDRRRVVAPEALNRYYFETAPGVHEHGARVAATWMTREHREHEIRDYIAYLDDLVDELTRGRPRPRLVALGFSQGAATVSRWAARGRTPVDRVILWGSSLAHELEPGPQLFRGAELIVAIGTADPHVAEERVAREDARLREAGLDYHLLRYAGGHRIEADTLLDIAG